MKSVRIFIADDHEMLRSGLRRLVERRPEWSIAGEAGDGHEVLAEVIAKQPDIVILDVAMPGVNGLKIAGQIKEQAPGVKIMIYTGDDDAALITAAFEAGASSFISKGDDRNHLVAAITALAEGKPYLTPAVAEVLLAAQFRPDKPQDLTPREREIVKLLAEGKSNQEVGTLLGISTRTVEVHRAAVMRKLELNTFADLVRYAVRQRIVQA